MLNYPIFAGASEATRAELTRRGKARRFGPGEILFHLGDRATDIFLIEAGRVKLWRTSEAGTAMTLAYVQAGELLGMIAAAQNRPQSVTATASVKTTATSWGATLLRGLIERDPVLAANVAALLAGRAELLVQRMEEMSFASADQRVARTLVRLGAEISDDDEPRPIWLTVTQREIAEMAQTTVPTVSRLIGRWRKAGLIGSTRGVTTILKFQELCALGGMDG